MKCKPLRLFLLVATVFGFALPTVSVVLAKQPGSKPSNSIVKSDSTTQATVEAITQQIASLEVERALQGSRFSEQSPTIQAIDSKLLSLRQRLVQIQPDGYKSAVTIAVSQAIKAKIAQLEVERARQGSKFMSSSPVIQSIDSRLQSLRQRLASL